MWTELQESHIEAHRNLSLGPLLPGHCWKIVVTVAVVSIKCMPGQVKRARTPFLAILTHIMATRSVSSAGTCGKLAWLRLILLMLHQFEGSMPWWTSSGESHPVNAIAKHVRTRRVVVV